MSPYEPRDLPVTNLDHSALIGHVGEANAALAEYSGMLQGIVNPNVMLSPLTRQEAVLSSKIEGTQATVEEVMEHEAGAQFDDEKKEDIHEIQNYRRSLIVAQDSLADGRSLNLSLVQALHGILMDSVRGKDKKPGEFRVIQNWIGSPGCAIEEATFIPPSPLQLNDHLERWQTYMAGDDFDVLCQTAVVHAQFELLHPFMDGNGRIGRLLIPLFLFTKDRLSSPNFYLSAYLERNRDEYYERLGAISRNDDWTGWIRFFLVAVNQQSKENVATIKNIMALYEKTKDQIRELTHSQFSYKITDALFDRPVFRIGDLAERADIKKVTVHNLLKPLLDHRGPLMTLRPSAGSRPAVLAFPELLNICEGKTFL